MERLQLILRSDRSTLKVYLPKMLIDKVRRRAKRKGITDKRYIKLVLERAAAKAIAK